MTMDTTHLALGESDSADPQAAKRREWLFHPIVDFLGLGGATLILLPIFALLYPPEAKNQLLFAMLVVANFVNHPHFAHSYQIFYRDFREKAFGEAYPLWLRRRYLFAGVIVPIGLIAYFALSFALESPRWMSLTYNLMGFLVGWHYVKQGYGMLMVDCALKKSFLNDREKWVLRANGYVTWAFTWTLANRYVESHDYFGLEIFVLSVPDEIAYLIGAMTLGFSLFTVVTLARAYWGTGKKVPINGLTAYLVTLYLWMIFARIDPVFLLVVPALHSLQYLLVVWRFQLNVEKGKPDSMEAPASPWARLLAPHRFALRLTLFLAVGLTAGFLGFFGLPTLLDSTLTYQAAFGPALFFFTFWIFINVHHYCLDNVMWRRENPETSKYLFASK
ncbi:MAG: hypothetical protein EP347_10665 [Alphaproteobacteria bacterium]|nr:MAG: hypothetical protein EP347_10665 [Alphaproteobacteria bacterium]